MTKEEVCQELIWCGLAEMTLPSATPRKFEAFGGGKLNVAHVLQDGTLKLIDGLLHVLWRGQIADAEQLIELLDEYGHSALT